MEEQVELTGGWRIRRRGTMAYSSSGLDNKSGLSSRECVAVDG